MTNESQTEVGIHSDSTVFMLGLPRWLSGKESMSNAEEVRSLSQEDLKKEMATHSSILSWEMPGRRSLAG